MEHDPEVAGALERWNEHASQLGRTAAKPLLRLLRCHAGDAPAACAEAFRTYPPG